MTSSRLLRRLVCSAEVLAKRGSVEEANGSERTVCGPKSSSVTYRNSRTLLNSSYSGPMLDTMMNIHLDFYFYSGYDEAPLDCPNTMRLWNFHPSRALRSPSPNA